MKKLTENNKILTIHSVSVMPNYKVYKSNKMIECKSDFSAMEHRIIVLALSQITPQDKNLKMYRINIQDVLGKKNHNSNYNIVRNAVRKLHKSTIDVEEIDGWKSYSFITKAQGKYGENFIEIQFHEDIQHFLLNMKSQYTSYTVANVINFKKSYSLRIYELCKQYAKIGQRKISLNYLRTLFCLEKKYINFGLFKKYVLTPAVGEINQYSDIFVDFKEIKQGKKVESISFSIRRNAKVLTEESAQTLEESSVLTENTKKLFSVGFDDNNIEEMKKKYGTDRIISVLELFEKNIDTIKFPKPWIENALKEKYTDTSDYKKKLTLESKEKEKVDKQFLAIEKKKFQLKQEKKDINDIIGNFTNDIEFYQKFDELKTGDIMRFPENFSVQDAIEYSEKKLSEQKLKLIEIEKIIKVLTFE